MSGHTITLFISNPLDRRLLADFLQQSGHTVHASVLPALAPELLSGTSVIIADEATAQRFGRSLLELKWRSGSAILPILITLPQRADSSAWLRAGFDDVLRQPITKEELRARLDVLLRFRDQAEQYRLMFENALIGMYRSTADGHLLIANAALLKMLGYNYFEEFLANTQGRGFVTTDPSRTELSERLKVENQVAGLESAWTRQDGTRLVMLENARAVRDEPGRMLYFEGSVEDITERKRAEAEREELLASERAARQEAEEASRLKDDFLATVSHELRTPLTAIMGWLQMLRKGVLAEQDAARALDIIERNARSQVQLIDDLLDVSRMITGKLRLDIRPIDPVSFIDAAIEVVRPAVQAKGVRLQKAVDDGLTSILGDSARLQQVVGNLLTNAVKFTPGGGQVEVRLERVDSSIEITVSDTGAGIDPGFLPFVFDRFRQADGSFTRKHGGLGLGLAIVRHIVELHGGTVHAESAGLGKGATFTVRLPMMAAHQDEGRELRPYSEPESNSLGIECPQRLDGVKVLVIDDEEDTREFLRIGFVECGAEVRAAESASEALATLTLWKPDVLVSDIGMPGGDGFELIGEIRRLSPEAGGRIPAVALTAYARAEDRIRAMTSGFQMHVAKPVEVAELVAVVASLSRTSIAPDVADRRDS